MNSSGFHTHQLSDLFQNDRGYLSFLLYHCSTICPMSSLLLLVYSKINMLNETGDCTLNLIYINSFLKIHLQVEVFFELVYSCRFISLTFFLYVRQSVDAISVHVFLTSTSVLLGKHILTNYQCIFCVHIISNYITLVWIFNFQSNRQKDRI